MTEPTLHQQSNTRPTAAHLDDIASHERAALYSADGWCGRCEIHRVAKPLTPGAPSFLCPVCTDDDRLAREARIAKLKGGNAA